MNLPTNATVSNLCDGMAAVE